MRVLGRTDELAVLDGYLGAVAGALGFAVLLITGEAGIGKTVLWNEGRRLAREQGFTLLTARPVEQEAGLDFAALCDLLGDVPDAVLDRLPAPQRTALRVALLRADAVGGYPDPRTVATATLGVLRELARNGPVLLAIDDLPWLDADTARVLGFALRRLGSERVGLLATVRTVRGDVPPLAIDDIDPAQRQTLRPATLSIGAIREMLADRLGFVPSRRLLVEIYEASDGNPYFAMELARTVDPASTVERLSVPDSLRRLLHGRVAQLPDEVREVLLGVALTHAEPSELVVAAAPDPAMAREHIEAAAAAGVLDLRGTSVAFTHPLLRSVLLEDAIPAQVRAAHGRLGRHATTASQRARHLALAAAAPDAEVAATLDAAAKEAHRRGANSTAAELAELAVGMTPADDPDSRRIRTLTAARRRFETGDATRARRLAESVVTADPPGPARGAARLQLATYERYCGEPVDRWTATLEAALADAAGIDPLLLAIHFALGFAAANTPGSRGALTHVRAVSELADRVDDRFLDSQAAAGIAWIKFCTGDGVRADLLDRALSGSRKTYVAAEESPGFTAAVTLGYAGDFAAATRLLEHDLDAAVVRGDDAGVPTLAWLLARLLTWTGDWARADELCEQGMRAADVATNAFGTASVIATRAILRACQGQLDAAHVDAARASELAQVIGLVIPAQLAAEAIAIAELSVGDHAAARSALAPLRAEVRASGVTEPRVLRHVPLEVEALIRLGESGEARRLLDEFADAAAAGAPSWASATAWRCRGLLLAAGADLRSAQDCLDSALSDMQDLGMPFELARTLLVAGEIHRRARRRRLANESLTRAREMFEGLGAAVWSQRCDAELGRLAGRPADAGSAALTETERRIARMAADGRTTREIAEASFVSARTVEAQLHSVYRKLGVRSRVELSRRLPGPTDDF